MAAEAEAAREARAKVMMMMIMTPMIIIMIMKVIAAEGEKKASQALREAADTISESPAALQLRYLQVTHLTLSIAHERKVGAWVK